MRTKRAKRSTKKKKNNNKKKSWKGSIIGHRHSRHRCRHHHHRRHNDSCESDLLFVSSFVFSLKLLLACRSHFICTRTFVDHHVVNGSSAPTILSHHIDEFSELATSHTAVSRQGHHTTRSARSVALRNTTHRFERDASSLSSTHATAVSDSFCFRSLEHGALIECCSCCCCRSFFF